MDMSLSALWLSMSPMAKGVVILMFIMSVYSLGIAAAKWWRLRRSMRQTAKFAPEFARFLQEGFVSLLQIHDEFLFVVLGIMDERTEQVQAILLKPMVNDINGGPFFTDEQDALAAGDVIGNQIGDRLRLARSRRPLNDVTLTGSGT